MTEVELVGNALCLDFANTVNARPAATRDWLATPEETLTWAHAVGLPIENPAELTRTLPEARELREAVFRVFEALTQGRQPPQKDLDAVLTTHAEGIAQARLQERGDVYELQWESPRTVRGLLWAVATSAVELLTHGPLDRLGAGPSCVWLFLDTSKNRRRRWCSMATCGSRDKSRRYYATRSS